jgi:hypothetical protein
MEEEEAVLVRTEKVFTYLWKRGGELSPLRMGGRMWQAFQTH